jgi:hypothetical protein
MYSFLHSFTYSQTSTSSGVDNAIASVDMFDKDDVQPDCMWKSLFANQSAILACEECTSNIALLFTVSSSFQGTGPSIWPFDVKSVNNRTWV